MDTIITYSLIAGVLSFVLTMLFGFADSKLRLVSAVIAGVLAALSEFLLLYFGQPSFAHWTYGGYVLSVAVVIVWSVIVLWGAVATDSRGNHNSAPTISVVAVIVVVGWFILTTISVHPYGIAAFDNETYDELALLINLQEPSEEELVQSASEADLLMVPPSQAKLEASENMPPGVGSYAQVGSSFEQTVASETVYITDLTVTNWRGFRDSGAALPGFFVRPARDISGETIFVPGYEMRYVPAARFNEDLATHVYLNYELDCRCDVEHLEVLELDDNMQPFYTGTAWRPAVGNSGDVPIAVITVDPQTGTITEYAMDQVPEWIDRVYSMEKIQERIEWWATYSDWDAVFGPQNNNGKMALDGGEDVYGINGELFYQFTITSIGSDQSLIHEIRVNPRTGNATIYKADGKTRQGVDDMIDERTYITINPSIGAEPEECERQTLLGQMTWYCILISRGSGAGSAGSVVGYAFLLESQTANPSAVIMDESFSDAWTAFRRFVANSGSDSVDLQAVGATQIPLLGNAVRVGNWPVDGFLYFTVVNVEYPLGIQLRVDANLPSASLMMLGDTVTVIAYDLIADDVSDVDQLIIETQP